MAGGAMNLGRALLQGAASGLKSAADQVAADHELDNRLRLMAVDDMFKQRIAEQGRNWNIEDRNQDRTWKNEDQQHAEDLATDTGYAGKLGQAAIAQAKPKLQFERDQKITDASNPDLLAANRALADSNQSTSDVNLKNKQADNYDAMANLRRAGVEFDSDGNPVRSSSGSKGKTKSLLDQALDVKESNIKEIASLQGLITNSIPRNSEEANYIQKRIDSLNKQNEAIGNSLLNFNAQSSEAPADLGNYTKFGLTKVEANKAVTRDYSQYQIDSIAKEKGVDPSLMKGMLNSESSISNPNAVSSAGAKGPFQFLDGTFKQYADKDMNDVNNPVHAARANANYINKLSEDFNDNPALVAAGYNAGEGRVKDAIKTLKSQGKEISTENIMSLMPSETQNYVPKVLAYKDFLDDKSQSKVADSGQIQSDAKPDEPIKVLGMATPEEIAKERPNWSKRYQEESKKDDKALGTGENKGLGWLGPMRLSSGEIMSELSSEAQIGDKYVSYPLVVPTTTKEELEVMANAERTKQKIPDSILQKAEAWAKQRVDQGKSPFASDDETSSDYLNLVNKQNEPKKQEPVYLDRDQKKVLEKTQFDVVKQLFEPKTNGEDYDNPHERLALFKNYVDSTGDISGAEVLALKSTFTNGVPTYNGKAIVSSSMQDEIRKSGKGAATESRPENGSKPSPSSSEVQGFDAQDIARINRFPDIVQQAIIKSPDPQKVLETFEKNNFNADSIKREILSSLTEKQRHIFDNMTAEQQKEFISNPESTINDYPDAVAKANKPSTYRQGLLGFN